MNASAQIASLFRSAVIGVECQLQEDECFGFRLCELSERKKKIEIHKYIRFTEDEAELKQALKKETAIHLLIQGRGIILKKSECNPEDTDEVLLNKCLPGVDSDDFYIQRYTIDEATAYIGIVRKELVYRLLNFFSTNKIIVASISLGPFVAEDIFPLLNLSAFIEQEVCLGNYELTVASGKINNIRLLTEAVQEAIDLQGLRVEGDYIFAFSVAMAQYMQTTNKINHTEIAALEEEHKEFKTHQKLTRAILLGVAAICIINFIVYKYYRSEFKDCYAEVQINQESLRNFDNMKLQFEEKKDVLDRNGLLEASRISYYSDKIAASLLQGINLTKMESFPMKKINVEGQEDYIFQNEKIIVSGTCEQSIDFNSWERILKRMEWIKAVSILNYAQEKESELAKFSVEIELRKK